MTEELKPCPFCGGIAKLNAPGYEHYSPYWCKCTRCGAEGPTKSSELEAETGWNKRVKDVLSLQKEQEPIKPTINEYGEAYCICGENVGIIPRNKNLPSIRSKYCSECGRRMKWTYD